MMKNLQSKLLIFIITLMGDMGISQAWASTNVVFIFDVSKRMSGNFPQYTKLNDLSKIEAASQEFEAMLRELPKDLNTGLIAYGHRGDKDCTSVEIMNPLKPLDSESMIDKVSQFKPERGATPLAKALQQGYELLSKVDGEKMIVLFSDSKDTCGGDMDAVMAQLKEQNIIVNLLGIDVKQDEVGDLTQIAAANNGEYYSVNSIEDIQNSLKYIAEDIEEKSPEKLFFRDDFNEKTLSSQWQVSNPDAKQLQINKSGVTFTTSVINAKKIDNVLRINAPAENRDWRITANFNVMPETVTDVFELGIASNDEAQMLLAKLTMNPDGDIFLEGIKDIKESTSSFHKRLISYKTKNAKEHARFLKQHIESITVKLEKMGMEYEVSAKLEPLSEADTTVSENWVTLHKKKIPLLSNDKFFIKAYAVNTKGKRDKDLAGEVTLNWVEIKIIK